jgi:hypothetical protein
MWSVFLILVLLIPLAAVVLDSKVGQALARRIEGGGPDSARMRALEAEVDRLSAELEQVREESQFVAKLLEERTSGEGRLPTGEGPQPGPAGD